MLDTILAKLVFLSLIEKKTSSNGDIGFHSFNGVYTLRHDRTLQNFYEEDAFLHLVIDDVVVDNDIIGSGFV